MVRRNDSLRLQHREHGIGAGTSEVHLVHQAQRFGRLRAARNVFRDGLATAPQVERRPRARMVQLGPLVHGFAGVVLHVGRELVAYLA